MALPMPRLAPVTRATRPFRSNLEPDCTTDTIARAVAISGKAAEDILERIFQPATKPSAMDQAEETLRHPKRLVYVAMSNKAFYWRGHIPKIALSSRKGGGGPLLLFDSHPLHTPPQHILAEAAE